VSEALKIVIVEDEPAAARLLKKMLGRVDQLSIDELDLCETIDEAMERLKHPTDLLFLDLNLRGDSGFDLLEKLAAEPFETIITTAYSSYAIKAFEYGVRDYVVKPFSQERLTQAVMRVPSVSASTSPALARIVVKEKGKVIPVSVDDIIAIRSAGDYAELAMTDGGKNLCSKRMDFLEQRLSEDFMRVHRTAIIRLSKVINVNVEPGGKYNVIMDGIEEPQPVGRKYYKELKERLA
jgi:DNA-binding LytR/AlgR family response regulator